MRCHRLQKTRDLLESEGPEGVLSHLRRHRVHGALLAEEFLRRLSVLFKEPLHLEIQEFRLPERQKSLLLGLYFLLPPVVGKDRLPAALQYCAVNVRRRGGFLKQFRCFLQSSELLLPSRGALPQELGCRDCAPPGRIQKAAVFLRLLPERPSHLRSVGIQLHAGQRIIRDPSHDAACRCKPCDQRQMGMKLLLRKRSHRRTAEENLLLLRAHFLIAVDHTAEAQSAGLRRVQVPDVLIQPAAAPAQAPQSFFILRLFRRRLGLQSAGQLLQDVFLVRLVRMKLQAEIPDTKGSEPSLHHGQGGHFLRDEQHSLPALQKRCDHACDGLGFSGPGRSVQHKSRAPDCGPDRFQLGGVRRHRQRQRFLPVLLRQLVLPVDAALQETPHDPAALQQALRGVNIVPDRELGEAEIADDAGLFHVPVFKAEEAAPHQAEYLPDVDAVLVRGERIQSADLQGEVLAQHLKKRTVEMRLLVAEMQPVPLGCRFPHHLRGQKDQRRVAGGALLLRVPLHQADGKIKTAHTVFQLGSPGSPVHLRQVFFHLFRRAEGVEAVVFVLLPDLLVQVEVRAGGPARQFEDAPFRQRVAKPADFLLVSVFIRDTARDRSQPLRDRHQLEFLTVGQRVLQFVHMAGKERDNRSAARQVQQHVPERQVQEPAFPELPFSRHFFRRDRGKIRSRDIQSCRGGCDVLLRLVFSGDHIFPAVPDPERQGTDPAVPRAGNIDRVPEHIRLGQHLLRHPLRIFKIHFLPCAEGRAFHKSQLIGPVVAAHPELPHRFDDHAVGLQLLRGTLPEPHSSKNMAVHHDKERVQTQGFQAGSVKERQVHAGAQTLLHHRLRCADPLTCGSEAGRRLRVDDVLLLDRGIGRRGKLPHPVGILFLVSVQGGRQSPHSKPLRGVVQQHRDHRVVRQDERSEEALESAASLPLIIGQDAHLLPASADALAVL